MVLLISAGAIAIKGLNLGIDFDGGTKITFTTPQPVALTQVRAQAAELGQGNAQILGRGATTGGDNYREFQIQTEELSIGEQRELTEALDQEFQADASVQTVSASFGRQIAEGAILAILVSLLLVSIYIAFRFEPSSPGR